MVRLFRVFIPASVVILLISELLILTAAYVSAVWMAGSLDPVEYLTYGTGSLNIAVVVITIMLGLYLHDMYSALYIESNLVLLQQLCFVLGGAFLIQGAISYIDRSLRMPLHVMLPGSAIAIVTIYGWRVLFSRYALARLGGDRVLLVGNSAVLTEVAAHLHHHPEKGVNVIGALTNDLEEMSLPGAKFLGRVDALREVALATRPTRIVVGMQERRSRVPVAELLDLRYSGHVIEEAPTTYERVCGRVCTKELRPSQLIYSGDYGPRHRTIAYQNVLNFAVAAVGIVVGAPLMLLTALAVRFTSPGPILYRQVRVGMGGVPFTVYKFRSMCVDAEAGTGAVWAQKNDPRVTTVGRIIRKIRFDELPQFFNVLKGEMSIVGPRPERPEFVKTLSEKIPYYRQRHAVRPGITGWAQINYKYGDTLEDTIAKLEYDLYYIKHMSLSLDAYIIFHTAKAMLLSRGAQ